MLWKSVVVVLVADLLCGSGTFCSNVEEQADNVDTLLLLHVLFRHGDRSPDKLEVYPKDPHGKDGFAPLGYGQLTKEGKQREYLIGKSLRQKYDRFLRSLEIESVVAKSTSYVRTRMSCLLVLAGLYPPVPGQVWKEDLLWQPIAYDYQPTQQDTVLGDPLKHCGPINRQYELFLQSPMGARFYKENKELYDYLSLNTGWDIKTPKPIYDLYFALKSEESMGLKLPEWTASVWPRNITASAADQYEVLTASPRMLRVAAGYLLKKIVDDTDLKLQEQLPPERKLYLYSAHEFNIAFMLKGLGVFEPHIPPFGSYITLEVHKIQDIFGYKILYQDYETSDPKLLKLPNCNEFCPIDKFRALTEVHFPLPLDCKED